jgi:hypothetical protein|tara:strand:+ start:1880 stop:2104 length:225 start_codon:yes stop_codon:yes gene_type:complete
MKRFIQSIQFDFTNHFGNPYAITSKDQQEEIIADAKNVLWDASTVQQLKQQLEITYGYQVIQVISDFYLPVEYV